MTSSRLDNARAIIESIIRKADQWGRHYDILRDNEYNGNQILDALRVVMVNAQFSEEDLAEKNLKLTKELRAAKAREGKLKKKIATLEAG